MMASGHRRTLVATTMLALYAGLLFFPNTQINDYTLTNGSTYYANANNVLLPSYLSSNVLGVYGLNSFDAYKSYDMIESSGNTSNGTNATPPPAYGGGPLGSGLTPSQIASIYNVTPVYKQLKDQGHGTTLALFELSSYKASDIAAYTKQFGLPNAKLADKKALDTLSAIDHIKDHSKNVASIRFLRKTLHNVP